MNTVACTCTYEWVKQWSLVIGHKRIILINASQTQTDTLHDINQYKDKYNPCDPKITRSCLSISLLRNKDK